METKTENTTENIFGEYVRAKGKKGGKKEDAKSYFYHQLDKNANGYKTFNLAKATPVYLGKDAEGKPIEQVLPWADILEEILTGCKCDGTYNPKYFTERIMPILWETKKALRAEKEKAKK